MRIKKPPPPAPGWTLKFEDLFAVDVPLGSFPAAVASRWTAYPYPWSKLGGFYYPEKVVSISGGRLRYHLHAENGQWLMAACSPRINPDGSNGQLYGRYEITWRADALPGYYLVPLLWPKSEVWPRDGEIDWPEGNLTSQKIGGFVHHQGATNGSDQEAFSAAVPIASGLHTTVLEWTPGMVRMLLDGALIGQSVTRVPNTPMRYVLQVTTSPAGLPPAGTDGYVEFESIRVWGYAP